MTLLAFTIVAVVIVVLLVWAIDYLPSQPMPANLLKFLVIVVGVLLILNRAGLL